MDNAVLKIYEILNAHYGNLKWWPAKTPYEVMVGAVLTQNTAWGNVEKAIANFGDTFFIKDDGVLKAQDLYIKTAEQLVLDMDIEQLKDIIRPAGFFNQKAAYLKTVTKWFAKYNFNIQTIQREPLEKLRPELLSVKGIGKETADCILLYAIGLPTFVVDAYTVRLSERYQIDAGKGYDAVKAYFESNLPRSVEIYNNYHALIVINGKNHCRKSKPLCDNCPLDKVCAKAGL